MTLLALLLSMAAQTGPVPYTAASPTAHELYAGPPVRPYEPSWGSTDAEGDAFYGAEARRIATPSLLRAYDGDYEASPTDGEVLYQQGVASAELRADSQMGPLDGRWRVTDDQGRVLMELLLMDQGGGRLVEGAWRAFDAPEGALTSRRLGAVSLITRAGDDVTIQMDDGDAPTRLTLRPDGAAWRGALERSGVSTPVVLAPAA